MTRPPIPRAPLRFALGFHSAPLRGLPARGGQESALTTAGAVWHDGEHGEEHRQTARRALRAAKRAGGVGHQECRQLENGEFGDQQPHRPVLPRFTLRASPVKLRRPEQAKRSSGTPSATAGRSGRNSFPATQGDGEASDDVARVVVVGAGMDATSAQAHGGSPVQRR